MQGTEHAVAGGDGQVIHNYVILPSVLHVQGAENAVLLLNIDGTLSNRVRLFAGGEIYGRGSGT